MNEPKYSEEYSVCFTQFKKKLLCDTGTKSNEIGIFIVFTWKSDLMNFIKKKSDFNLKNIQLVKRN